jgi:hypothetical protein
MDSDAIRRAAAQAGATAATRACESLLVKAGALYAASESGEVAFRAAFIALVDAEIDGVADQLASFAEAQIVEGIKGAQPHRLAQVADGLPPDDL